MINLCRKLLLHGLARSAAAPILRLSLGRWPDNEEVRLFACGFTSGERVLPPILRGLAEVPAAKERIGQLAVLNLVREGVLRKPADLGPHRIAIPSQAGNPLSYWQGRPFSFLHFEKSAGTSVASMLTELFHPLQVHDDPQRGMAPHVLSAFLPDDNARTRQHAFAWGHYDLPALRRLDPTRPVITVLREPRSRILSLYHFWKSVDPVLVANRAVGFNVTAVHEHDLLDYLRSDDPLIRNYIDNVYTRRLTGTYVTGTERDELERCPEQVTDEALRALDGLAYAGVVEQIGRDLPGLGQRLGISLPAALPRLNATDGNHTGRSLGYVRVAREQVTPQVEAELDRLTRLDVAVYRRALARLAAEA